MGSSIQIVVGEDHLLVREGLRQLDIVDDSVQRADMPTAGEPALASWPSTL